VPRVPLLASLLFASACAGASHGTGATIAPPTTVTPTTQRVTTGGGATISINTVNVNSGSSTLIVTTVDSAWAALKVVYGELGIPVTTLVDAQRLIGNEGYRVRRRIGRLAMQDVLDCGGSQGMPNAETYDIWLTISSTVAGNPKGGAILLTRIDATAKSPTFNRNQSVSCASQGVLEKAIAEAVRTRVGK
jgi:hypothetical protein